MGQYYVGANLDKLKSVYSRDYNDGQKLMEHSWLRNRFVGAVEMLIAAGGDWHGDRLVWAGDYADEEPDAVGNLYQITTRLKKQRTKVKYYRYILNMDTKQYVDKRKVPVSDEYISDKGNKYCYRIHPLPLLTCEGNGRGSGDFHGNSDLVSKWARQRITVSNEIPEGYTELKFDLIE